MRKPPAIRTRIGRKPISLAGNHASGVASTNPALSGVTARIGYDRRSTYQLHCSSPLPSTEIRMSGEPIPGESSYASPMGSPSSAELTQDEKLWAMLAHLAGLLGYAVAFGQYIGPLVIYLLYKDKSRFVAFHALQSLYFQLGVLVAGLLVVVLFF